MLNLRNRVSEWWVTITKVFIRRGMKIDERADKTILHMCDHPLGKTLKPVLLERHESRVRREYGAADVLTVTIRSLSGAIWRKQVYFVVPRSLLEFQLEWGGDPSNPIYSLIEINEDGTYGKRYEEGALH
ncbi:MAG: hypothetical protein FJ044_03170 [Candidatus Cloacimonetes bacterium]|nr:hypothetical protein [Candidatus Cloacimonadota bacterium]